jgi:exosortase
LAFRVPTTALSSFTRGIVLPRVGLSDYGLRVSAFMRSSWTRYWKSILIVLAVLLLYGPVLIRLATQALGDPNYSHSVVVPIFCLYLIWQKREDFAHFEKQPSSVGLIVVLVAILLLYLGSIGAELFVSRFSLVLLIVGLVLYFYGWGCLQSLAFPICFLLLMIPLPSLLYNRIVFPLQLLSSRFATSTLELIRVVPVLRQGNLLILPHYTLEVVEACSGIRSLMSLVALGLGYSYLAERNVWVRTSLVAAMFPIAIVGNGVRVVCAALLAHSLGPKTAEGFLHPISGIVIFVVAIIMLLGLHAGISKARYLLTTLPVHDL